MQPEILIAICVAVVIVFALLMGILSRYRKCPSDKILVIYGKVGSDKNGQARSAKCVHGGAAFIMPIIQSFYGLNAHIYQCRLEERTFIAEYPC